MEVPSYLPLESRGQEDRGEARHADEVRHFRRFTQPQVGAYRRLGNRHQRRAIELSQRCPRHGLRGVLVSIESDNEEAALTTRLQAHTRLFEVSLSDSTQGDYQPSGLPRPGTRGEAGGSL